MKIPDRWLVWIGALAGLVGFFILNFAPLDGLLPINQGLFAALCSLLVIWLLLFLIQTMRDRL